MMTAVADINNLGARAYNPRGNLWVNDNSTYGHKLMMKMGWSKGKGLGKNEDGIKENISVKFRNTNSGLGFKDDAYTNVMKTEYEAILKNLNDVYSQNETCSVQKENTHERKSCEQKSRVIGSRLRYPKLFFGKDVSKYSEKDMKSIFICSQPSKDNEEILEDSIVPQKKESERELPKEVETHSSPLSISDYFAKKMKERKSNVLSKEPLSDPDLQQPSLDPEITKTDNVSTISNKKSKKRGMNPEISFSEESFNNSNLQQTETEAEVARTVENSNLGKKKSSKKRKRTEINEVETDTAHAIDLQKDCLVTNYKKQKVSEVLDCENNVFDRNEKKTKSEIHRNGNCSADVEDGITHNVSEDKTPCQIELSSDAALHLKKKLKKLKKRNMLPNEMELPIENSQLTNGDPSTRSVENELSSDATYSKKNKKRKKMKIKKIRSCLKSKRGSYSIKNVSFNESVCYRVIDTDIESVDCLSDAFSLVQNDLMDEVFVDVDKDTGSNDNEIVDAVDKVKASNGSEVVDVVDKDITECSDSNEVVAAVDKDESGPSDNNEVVSLDRDKIESSGITAVCQGTSSDTKICGDSVEVSETISDAKLMESCQVFDLPSKNSPHYNAWVESQRQALKMDLYKRMLKKMQKHQILESSNLLSIQGYGNWGFK